MSETYEPAPQESSGGHLFESQSRGGELAADVLDGAQAMEQTVRSATEAERLAENSLVSYFDGPFKDGMPQGDGQRFNAASRFENLRGQVLERITSPGSAWRQTWEAAENSGRGLGPGEQIEEVRQSLQSVEPSPVGEQGIMNNLAEIGAKVEQMRRAPGELNRVLRGESPRSGLATESLDELAAMERALSETIVSTRSGDPGDSSLSNLTSALQSVRKCQSFLANWFGEARARVDGLDANLHPSYSRAHGGFAELEHLFAQSR